MKIDSLAKYIDELSTYIELRSRRLLNIATEYNDLPPIYRNAPKGE